jgi:hypothetical protein
MKEKKCKVCYLFDEQKFSDEIRFDINKLIKSKEKLEVLNKQTGFNLTEHYYKKHRDICLLNFEIPIEKQKTELIQDKETIENSYNSIDVLSLIEKYRNMSVRKKENQTSILINEINFISLNIVHHQLINGRDNLIKGFIPKDDISCLKIINDIMKGKSIDELMQNENIVDMFDVIPFELKKQVIEAYYEAKELNPELKIATKDGSTSTLDILDDKKIIQIYEWFEEAKEKKLKENNKILN